MSTVENQIVKYTYEGQIVEFDISTSNVMVNATEMAKIFGRQTNHFFENEETKRFIAACLSSRNSGNLKVEKEGDLYTKSHRYGTWMHRVLALKFAAWLDADFEVWVYHTIDQIIQARGPINSERVETRKQVNARIRKNQAKARKAQMQIEKLAGQAMKVLTEAQIEIAKDSRILARLNREDANQLNIFVNTQNPEEDESEATEETED